MTVRIEGQVKPYVLIEPPQIELTGKAGKPISSKVTLTPASPEIQFKIPQVTAKDNKYIRFSIKRVDEAGPYRYELTVENTKPDPGFYADVITIFTDTSRKFMIRVFGNITE